MKRYLNRQERNDVMVLAAFLVFTEDLIANWTKLGKSKELLKNARTCKTYANKVASFFIDNLDDAEKIRLLKDCKKHNVAAVLRSDHDKLAKQKEIIPVVEEDLKDLTDHALVVCQTCGVVGDKVAQCRLRELPMNYAIPPFDLLAQPGQCQYKIPDFQDRMTVIKGLLKGA